MFIDRLLTNAKDSANPNPILGTEREKELLGQQLQKLDHSTLISNKNFVSPKNGTKTTYYHNPAMTLDHN